MAEAGTGIVNMASFNGERVAGPSVLVRHGAYVRVALEGALEVPAADILVRDRAA